MRIAYLSLEYPPRIFGGLGVYVDEMSRGLRALGESVSVFTPGELGLTRYEDRGGVEVFRMSQIAIRDGLEFFLSPQTLAWGSGLTFWQDLLSVNQLSASSIIENGPFDLCVAHDWLGLWGGMALKREGLPMIYHVHGLENGRSVSPNPQIAALEGLGAEQSDLVLTVSEAMKRELLQMGVSSEKVFVCHHGVDSGFFDPEKADPEALAGLRKAYGFSEWDLVILFVGRLEPVKGVRELFASFSRLRRDGRRPRLLIVGRGSLEPELRRQMEGMEKGSVTLVTDFIGPAEKRLHYALADLCVFPSIYEPFGIVALEAAAMGKAAVVGAAGTSGLAEIVNRPGTVHPTGVHVNGSDPSDIAWGINLAFEDLDRLTEWGRNARARALESFTWRRAAERTREIYRRVA